MTQIALSCAEAKARLLEDTTLNKQFREAVHEHWKCSNGAVSIRSVLWLFCWAKTGGASKDKTAAAARDIFNQLRPYGKSFADFDTPAIRSFAEKYRYDKSNKTESDIEAELKILLGLSSATVSFVQTPAP